VTSLALLVFSIIPLVVLGILLRAAYRAGSALRTVILGATFFHESALVVFPIWYSVFTGFNLEREINTSPDSLLEIMVGEAIFVALFGLSMSFGTRTRTVKRWRTDLSWEGNHKERVLIVLLSSIGVLINLLGFLKPVESYEEFTHHADVVISSSWSVIVWDWTQGAFYFPSLIAAALLVVGPKVPRVLRLVGATSLALLALQGLSSGVRGRLTWVVSLLVIIGYLMNRRKPIYVGVGILLLVLPLFTFLGGDFRVIYYSQLEGDSRVQALNRIVKSVETGESKDPESEGLVANLAERAQGPRNSIILHELYDTGQSAGFRPLISALYLPIPRVLWPDKRPAGSIDMTNFGSAVYLVRRIGYGAPIYNMGPVLSSAHAYWEWGWLGVLLSGFITGLFWNGLLTLCDGSARPLNLIVVLTFSAALLIDGFLTALNPLYAIVRSFWLGVVPTLLLYVTILLIVRIIEVKRAFSAQPLGAKKAGFARSHWKITRSCVQSKSVSLHPKR
jgi:hypothetical protein